MNYCLFFLAFLATAHGARILAVYPTPSISHQVVFRPLMMELARRGHEVTVITTDAISQEEAPANYTQVDVHDISYKYWREEVVSKIRGTGNNWEFLDLCVTAVSELVDLQMSLPEVQKAFDSGQRYDLIFVESFYFSAYALSHIFKAPLILFTSMGFPQGLHELIGATGHVFLYPNFMRKKLHNLSMYEKISILYDDYFLRRYSMKQEKLDNAVIKKHYGPDFPAVDKLMNNVDMLFTNVNPLWDSNRPVPPSVVYTGGLHIKPQKDLPEDLKTYLDSSKNGVIYMSFGTNVDPTLLPPERIQIFCEVFSKLPYDVLWKWNGDELPGKPENVRTFKWLPQSDLLRHPKIKLFITQAGLQSTDEAIVAGVPLIAFPMLGDQWFNAEKYEQFGIGKHLDFSTVTEEVLRKEIESVIGDGQYKENIERLGILMRDQPQNVLERAVWWTEYVLRHRGAKHLRSPQANMSWSEYLELDVVLVLLVGMLLTALVLSFVLFKSVTVMNRLLFQCTKHKTA